MSEANCSPAAGSAIPRGFRCWRCGHAPRSARRYGKRGLKCECRAYVLTHREWWSMAAIRDRPFPYPEQVPVAAHPPSSCSASSSERFELEGNVNGKWRLVAVHPTLAKANADAAEYEEWCKGAVNKWEGFRIVRVTTTRDIMPNTDSAIKKS